MRLDRWVPLLGLWLVARSAAAQPGSIQIVTATQVTTGDPLRRGDQARVDPDLGLLLFRPHLPFGTLELDLHLIRRRERAHLGRSLAALSGRTRGNVVWRIEAGDTNLAPTGVDYGFANLFAPPLALKGVALSLVGPTTSLQAAAGYVTALRNLFGTDPETLGQSVVAARVSHRLHRRVRLVGRASGVRTTDLGEFSYTVQAGRDAGAGVVVSALPQLEIVAEAGVNRYRRRGDPTSKDGPSALLGARWSFARGWLQVNAQHFSPGQFPALNMPFHDRRGAFAATEIDLTGALRLFGGLDATLTNLSPPDATLATGTTPPAEQVRTFGGVRLRAPGGSVLTLRAERGARLTRPVAWDAPFADEPPAGPSARVDSHADIAAAEWQGGVRRWRLVGRVERRSHIQVGGTNFATAEDDGSIQVFRPISLGSEIFGSAFLTRRRSADRNDQVFWQANVGGQVRLARSDLYARLELTAARTYDFGHNVVTTRRALGVGLTGRLSPRTTMALHVFVDRTPVPGLIQTNPWLTRALVRVSRTIPIGAGVRPVPLSAAPRRPGAVGAVTVVAYADWNGNGAPDPGDDPVPDVAIRLGAAVARTGADGRAAFINVPVGPALVALDPAGVPALFDIPADPARSVTIAPTAVAAVTFPLVPLGAITGRVLHDANGNGQADVDDRPVDEVVLLLDGGQRSELTRAGHFRFDAVRAGAHEVELLVDSLEPGTVVIGDVKRAISVLRHQPEPEVVFLLRLGQRAEIRRVFAPRAAEASPSPGRGAPRPAPAPRVSSARPEPASPQAGFTVQVSAMRNPQWVTPLVQRLAAKGYGVYVVAPAHPGDFYRVRVGRFATARAAEQLAVRLRAAEGLAAWVTRANGKPASR